MPIAWMRRRNPMVNNSLGTAHEVSPYAGRRLPGTTAAKEPTGGVPALPAPRPPAGICRPRCESAAQRWPAAEPWQGPVPRPSAAGAPCRKKRLPTFFESECSIGRTGDRGKRGKMGKGTALVERATHANRAAARCRSAAGPSDRDQRRRAERRSGRNGHADGLRQGSAARIDVLSRFADDSV